MAIMMPDVAREFDTAGLEGVMFDSLKNFHLIIMLYILLRIYMLKIIYFMKVK